MLKSLINLIYKKVDFKIHVTTGDKLGAGTDSTVYFQLVDSSGAKTETVSLDHLFKNDHERGETHIYDISATGLKKPDSIDHIVLWRDKFGIKDNWFLDRVEVEEVHCAIKRRYVFPIQRWIKARRHYHFYEFDAFLPQDDPQPKFRISELKEKRSCYELQQLIRKGPIQVKNLPSDETFSLDFKIDIVLLKSKLKCQKFLLTFSGGGRWESIEQIKGIFVSNSMPRPLCVDDWHDDKWFGLQRVQGVNPVLLQLCTQIPDKLAVTSEMVDPFLESFTLEEAIENNRIFIIDLKILNNIKCKDPSQVLVSPIALLYRNKENDLMPIAIQLFQEPGPENPVYFPNDPPYTWLMAKMFYNMADAQQHQSCTHLGSTHLLMETMSVSVHRNLSPSHPIYRLLAPHFLYLLAINSRGIDKLIQPGGWVDCCMTVGREGMFELIKRGFRSWKLDIQGDVEREIESRGVLDPEILPVYPYRDDAVPLYRIIKKYVYAVVHYYYETTQKLDEDWEVQAWVQEMAPIQKQGGLGVGGIPSHLDTVDQLAQICTTIIATCSLGHAAANFQQYDAYGFVPNFAGILHGLPPKQKKEMTEKDLLEFLPNKEKTLDIMVITKLLSTKGTKSLGDFEVQYHYDPKVIHIADEFRLELKKLSREIKERNRTVKHKYEWLDPEFVPNSISI